MRPNIFQFYKISLKNFFEALVNFFIFLQYFFSVNSLIKTLFFPWKNLIAKKITPGFSFNEWLSRFAFNNISRSIGFFMRMSIILFYFICQIVYMIFIPLIVIIYFLFIPVIYLEKLFQKTEEKSKKILRDKFISTHLIKEENRKIVEHWFAVNYQKHIKKQAWWKLSNLLSIPPLARDWAVGYTPTLDQYSEELTATSYQSHRKHIVNRLKEIAKIEQVLSQLEEANVVIVGEEGIGKHTIIDALSKKIYEGKINISLMYKRVLKLNMEKILNQFSDQKQRENFFEELLKEADEAKNIIILIDKLERYIASDRDKVDLSSSIAKFSKYGNIKIIGITDPFSYQKYFISNDALNRLFTKIDVYEISDTEAEEILLDNFYLYEQKYKLNLPYETLKAVIDKSNFFITNIPFPEKALHLLDSVCSYGALYRQSIVLPDLVDKILSEFTHVPTVVTPQMKDKLLHLEKYLNSKIIQQEEAIKKLSSALKSSFILIDKRKKPLASFLFLGPTGVGKTQTAKTLASVFFGTDKNILRFDMSLYQSKEDITNLIGSINSANPGLLSKAIRERPYGVLLLDEIEKADKDLLNIFLTILDEGYFTDGSGKKVDCKNLIIIATSNAGADYLYRSEQNSESLIDYLVQNKIFSPEFLNRFDGVVVYQPLSEDAIVKIAQIKVDNIASEINKLHKITLHVSNDYLYRLAHSSYNQKFGARNMERLIKEEIEEKIATLILENRLKPGDIIKI